MGVPKGKVGYLRQKGQDGSSCMPTNNWDINILQVQALCLCNKGVGTDNIQGCHSH